MNEKKEKPKKLKRVGKSIRGQIIATGLCPLVIMSTTVSVLALNGYDSMMLSNLIALILFIGVVQLLYVASVIVKPLRQAEACIIQMSEGNLDITIDEKTRKRDDEIGTMAVALLVLNEKLKGSIFDIQQVSEKLVYSEEILEKMVEGANVVTGQIESAMLAISDDSKKQNHDMIQASSHVEEIGMLIGNIVGSVQHLEESSDKMKQDGKQSAQIMDHLDESNKRTNDAIERINKQVHLTYEASIRINDVIQMITAIAKQTVLLALNASIEAARAGEHGKGFSVVAEEISKLANQSSESAKEIDEIVGDLSTESGKMLHIMNEVLTDVEKQREKLIETQGHFGKVNEGIEDSRQEISDIREQTEICDASKDKITRYIEELKNISEESVHSTNITRESVSGLNQNINEIEATAGLLKDYAETLNNQVQFFSVK